MRRTWIFLFSILILSALLVGVAFKLPETTKNHTPEGRSANVPAKIPTSALLENPPIAPDQFKTNFLGYVYGTTDITDYLAIYWCYPRSRVNQSLAIAIEGSMITPFGSISYNGEEIPKVYRGYLALLTPINLSKIQFSTERHIMKSYDTQVIFHAFNGINKTFVPLNLGNWTFDIVKTPPTVKPNITAYMNEDVEFTTEPRTIFYTFGLYNPFDIPINVLNVSFELEGKGIARGELEAYEASSIYDIPNKSLRVLNMTIRPKGTKYFAVPIRVESSVVGFFIRPKVVYEIENETYEMPGPPFQYTVIEKPCWYNYNAG